MERYAHPVWRNGHKVLYHGAWRDGRGGRRSASRTDSDDDDDSSSKSSSHDYYVLVDPDDATALRMATELVDSAKAAGLKAHAWAGKTSPEALRAFVRSDGGDFAVAPTPPINDDELRRLAPLVTSLGYEPLTVIAASSVTELKQLNGRAVAVGEVGGAADATAQTLFSASGISPKYVHTGLSSEFAALASGKVDAVVVLSADESKAVADATRDGKLHVVAAPWRPEYAGKFAPLRMNAKDLPGLLHGDGVVETVGAPMSLFAVDAADGTPRAAQDAPFINALFEKRQPMQAASADPKWRDVNLSADSTWPKLEAVRDWVGKHPAKDDADAAAFREAARDAATAGDANAPATADKLYNKLLQTGGGGS